MTNKFVFNPGVYRIEVPKLLIHGTPSEDVNSRIGTAFTIGKEIPVYDKVIDNRGWVWGVVTPPEAPQHHYVCLWNLNTVFAKWIAPLGPMESEPNQLVTHAEFDPLVQWAILHGYKKP